MYTTSERQVVEALLKKANYFALPLMGVDETFHPEWTVDDLDNPRGMFFSAHYFSFLYSEDENYLSTLSQERFNDGFYGFSGTHPKVFEFMKDRFFVDWLTVSSQYHYVGLNESVEGQYVIEPVQLEWAEEINENYEYKSDNTIYEIKRAIETRPSACIRIDGTLACWVLLHDDYSIGFMYTKTAYRKLGLAKLVSQSIVKACIEKGITPFLQIVHGNHKSEGLASKTGFVKHSDVYWFGIVVPGAESCKNLRENYEQFFKANQPIQYISSYGMLQLKDQASAYTIEFTDETIQIFKDGVFQCDVQYKVDGDAFILYNEVNYIDWLELLKAIRASKDQPYIAVMFSGAQTIEGVQSILLDQKCWSQKL